MPNWRGMYALFAKEVWRFLKVTIQTVLSPVVTTLLYILVFGQALDKHVQIFSGISYLTFLIPGLMMMNIINNAFSNSSSSIIQSKMNGNLVFVLLSPLSSMEFFVAFTAAAVLRGVLVGLVVFVTVLPFVDVPLHHLGLVLLFGLLSSATLGALGVIVGIWAEKYDQLAAMQNFVVLPLSFLSGAFYSLFTLSESWQWISRLNPFFYMVDGFRYGFFGQSDVSPWLSLWVCGGFFLFVSTITLILLSKGYKIRG